jgi:hypothetical protein
MNRSGTLSKNASPVARYAVASRATGFFLRRHGARRVTHSPRGIPRQSPGLRAELALLRSAT